MPLIYHTINLVCQFFKSNIITVKTQLIQTSLALCKEYRITQVARVNHSQQLSQLLSFGNISKMSPDETVGDRKLPWRDAAEEVVPGLDH